METSIDLYSEYTFDTLVVGSSNQFAYAASKAVAHNLGTLYNPMIIYGNVGLGKTHLLHSIGHEVLFNELKVTYDTFENFFNELRKHITANTMEFFRDKYRDTDLLLLDDIQFIANKTVLQEEFFNTFNDLKRLNKQVVLTSDRHPKELMVEERIKNRLEGGLIVEILVPDLETKKEIIRKKCKRNRILFSEEMVSYIATNVVDNVRNLEGIILKIHAYSVLMEEKITLDFVKHVVDESKSESEQSITLEKIIKEVSSYCNVKPSEMKSRARSQAIVKARRIALYLARELTSISMVALAKEFNFRDHASVSNALKSLKKSLNDDRDLYDYVAAIQNRIK